VFPNSERTPTELAQKIKIEIQNLQKLMGIFSAENKMTHNKDIGIEVLVFQKKSGNCSFTKFDSDSLSSD
jgi:macrodomain Ter protein organizer (MatP/YcbG family)